MFKWKVLFKGFSSENNFMEV